VAAPLSRQKCTEAEFIDLFRKLKSTKAVALHLGCAENSVRRRKARLRGMGINLPVVDYRKSYDTATTIKRYSGRVELTVQDGAVVVFSDAHYFPGEPTTAHKGLLKVLKQLKPVAVICNGDAFDGATISRHPRIGWDNKPTVKQELEAVEDRLHEIIKVSGQAKHFWPLGNHDARYETFLAANSPQYEGVPGFSLKDRFPAWNPCWSVFINGNTMIKHRYHNGIHAAYNNALKSGTSIVTGHLHSLKVTPWTDYKGDRYGVDTGTLADVGGPQFQDYLEDNPVNWRSGFAVLTFKDGQLMPPELAQVVSEGRMFWRGEVLSV
jgi:hypothetical protein